MQLHNFLYKRQPQTGHNRSAICNMICTSVFCLNFIFAPEQLMYSLQSGEVFLAVSTTSLNSTLIVTRKTNTISNHFTTKHRMSTTSSLITPLFARTGYCRYFIYYPSPIIPGQGNYSALVVFINSV